MSESSKRVRTINIEPDEHMLIKPGELIDIVELSPLTLQDRRIYNLLILNAWDSITGIRCVEPRNRVGAALPHRPPIRERCS